MNEKVFAIEVKSGQVRTFLHLTFKVIRLLEMDFITVRFPLVVRKKRHRQRDLKKLYLYRYIFTDCVSHYLFFLCQVYKVLTKVLYGVICEVTCTFCKDSQQNRLK